MTRSVFNNRNLHFAFGTIAGSLTDDCAPFALRFFPVLVAGLGSNFFVFFCGAGGPPGGPPPGCPDPGGRLPMQWWCCGVVVRKGQGEGALKEKRSEAFI